MKIYAILAGIALTLSTNIIYDIDDLAYKKRLTTTIHYLQSLKGSTFLVIAIQDEVSSKLNSIYCTILGNVPSSCDRTLVLSN